MSVRRALAAAMAALALACVPPDQRGPYLEPDAAPSGGPAPTIRIGLQLPAGRDLTLASDAGLVITDPEEGEIARLLPGESVDGVASGGELIALRGGATPITRRRFVLRSADSSGTVQVGAERFRGTIELDRAASRIRIVNRLDLEQYLLGVVGAEMGRRAPGEEAALMAQAVAARTYALKNLGRWEAEGYDLVADVAAQAYAGVRFENALAADAVARTRGEILTYQGAPIDAFYYSTCGGRTEEGREVYPRATHPYLTSIVDADADGRAYCEISPRYRWTERWSAPELTAVLRRTLAAERLGTGAATGVRELRVLDRTVSGRIARLELSSRGGRAILANQAIRRVLQPPRGGILMSTDFTARIERSGGRVTAVQLEGRGNGHGVGMCQWGAVGRARAGQDYRTILSTYFPGTDLEHAY
ncbi:MAG TPA: SpoIID/LytB domain-containing protein [Gemmatimonadales bacterium]|nr:SpoIID/LytB domain-containing protein [Gemmatimonadales bacterium]